MICEDTPFMSVGNLAWCLSIKLKLILPDKSNGASLDGHLGSYKTRKLIQPVERATGEFRGKDSGDSNGA
jgi:hypothetical protein